MTGRFVPLVLVWAVVLGCENQPVDVVSPGPVPGLMSVNSSGVENVKWIRQFGTSGPDEVIDIKPHDAEIYVAGAAGGTLPGQVYSGGYQDAFVRKFDIAGNEIWTREFGTAGWDMAHAAATTLDGGVVVTGMAGGSLSSQPFAGGRPPTIDAFVRRYDSQGNEIWTREFGTAQFDNAVGVAVAEDGSIYVAGITDGVLPRQKHQGQRDIFVRKYSGAGDERWTRQFGSPGLDEVGSLTNAIVVDGQFVYVAGFVEGPLPNQTFHGIADAFVRKYDADGNEIWTRQIGTAGFDDIHGLAIFDGNLYLAGSSDVALPGFTYAGGIDDVVVWKYDSDGNELWVRELGTPGFDHPIAAAAGKKGVYAVGYTDDAFPGHTNAGDQDLLVIKFDTEGNLAWILQFGTPGHDAGYAAAVADGGLFVGGVAGGALPGQTLVGGPYDAYFARIQP